MRMGKYIAECTGACYFGWCSEIGEKTVAPHDSPANYREHSGISGIINAISDCKPWRNTIASGLSLCISHPVYFPENAVIVKRGI